MGKFIDINVNTDGLAKLAEIVIFALGGTARGEKKMADAKAYAMQLEAKTKNDVAMIEAQGQEALAGYIASKEARKLKNTVAVIEKAQSHFSENEKVSDTPVDEGWKNRFFGIVEEISDEELREIWGRVLAGEIKQPGSYSLRTLETLRNITKEEAAVIVKASPFLIQNESIYKDSPLSLQEKLLLQELGLMLEEGLGIEYKWEVPGNEKLFLIMDDNHVFSLQNDTEKNITCHTKVYKLSTSGREIFKLVSVDEKTRDAFYHTLVSHFRSNGISHVYKHEIVSLVPQTEYKIVGEEIA